ncbi:MAG: hypothetical protein J6E46_01025 [Faecalicoccus sp.]|nr:hypothetical protein [Faecalicoccus sp.]
MSKSIYQDILDHMQDGVLNSDFSIENIQNGIPYAPGALDGIFMYHMANPGLNAQDTKEMAKAIRAAAKNNYEQADALFFAFTKKHHAIQIIDFLQQHIDRHIEHLDADNLFQCALSLVLHSVHIECVKIGLSILELFHYGDMTKEVVRRLGAYDEFTIFVIWNMLKWEHGNDEIFALAQKVEGWGRIHAVERLEPLSDEIRHWLLTEGTQNDVINSYSSLTCWMKSKAEEILFDHPGQKEFEGISLLIEGMLDERPVKGISGLENPDKILLRYLTISSNYEHSTTFYKLVMSIKTWNENRYPSITDACDDILYSPECMETLQDENIDESENLLN